MISINSRCFRIMSSFLLLAITAIADQQDNRVIVTSFDSSGKQLRDGLGFVYDSRTIVCSYHDVKDAAMLRIQWQSETVSMNRLSSFNDQLDLAILKSETELVEPLLGSSDMLSAGDKIGFFARRGADWFPAEGTVAEFVDTGEGYEEIQLEIPQVVNEEFEPAPLYDSSGKVVGWRVSRTIAISLDTIHKLVIMKSSAVPLSEVNHSQHSRAGSGHIQAVAPLISPKYSKMKTVSGPAQYPFRVELPADWKQENLLRSGVYSLRCLNPDSGILIEIQVSTAGTVDFTTTIERAETLLFPEWSRSEMIPYSSDYFTGMRASYDDPESPYRMGVFYTMAGSSLYTISIQYPQRFHEQAEEILDRIVASFRI